MSFRSCKLFPVLLAGAVFFGIPHKTIAQQPSPTAELARKEGEVVWYGSQTVGTIGRVLKAIEDKYPFLKTRYLRLGSHSLIERVRTEARAGRYLWDLVSADYVQFFELEKIVSFAQYRSPEAEAYPKGYTDPNGAWVDIYGTIASIGYNTRMVRPSEVPKDWNHLLDPKWKGRKIGLTTAAYQWYGAMVASMGEEKGREFMRALAAQQPQMQTGYTNTANLLTAGEFPVAVIRIHRVETAREAGAPVDWASEANPMTYDIHPMAISTKAPHPSAARLVFDFLISKEGQELFTREGFISSRVDAAPRFPRLRLSAMKHVVPSNPKVSERLELWIKEFQRTFKTE